MLSALPNISTQHKMHVNSNIKRIKLENSIGDL